MQRLIPDNPVVLVTGSGRKGRVGEAIAREFHQKNYNIVIHCNQSVEEANLLADEFNALRPSSASVVQCDLSGAAIDQAAARMIEVAHQQWRRLDVVINSASLFEMSIPGDFSLARSLRLMQINAIAPMLITQSFAKALCEQKGCVINISDVFAKNPSDTHAEYNASKMALEKFTIDAAKSFSNLRVVAITPGAMLRPDGMAAKDDHFNGYEGAGPLIDKIFEVLRNEKLNGCIVRSVKGIDEYPVNFFAQESNKLK